MVDVSLKKQLHWVEQFGQTALPRIERLHSYGLQRQEIYTGLISRIEQASVDAKELTVEYKSLKLFIVREQRWFESLEIALSTAQRDVERSIVLTKQRLKNTKALKNYVHHRALTTKPVSYAEIKDFMESSLVLAKYYLDVIRTLLKILRRLQVRTKKEEKYVLKYEKLVEHTEGPIIENLEYTNILKELETHYTEVSLYDAQYVGSLHYANTLLEELQRLWTHVVIHVSLINPKINMDEIAHYRGVNWPPEKEVDGMFYLLLEMLSLSPVITSLWQYYDTVHVQGNRMIVDLLKETR